MRSTHAHLALAADAVIDMCHSSLRGKLVRVTRSVRLSDMEEELIAMGLRHDKVELLEFHYIEGNCQLLGDVHGEMLDTIIRLGELKN